MKKIILVLTVLCLTGCVGNKDFSKTCIEITNTKDLETKNSMEVSFNNKDQVTKSIVTKTYKAKNEAGEEAILSIKESASDYNNALLKKEGIKISVSKDTLKEYEVKYYLDTLKMKKSTLELFNLKQNSIKFFNKMRSDNIECK